jgi:hypothetical protein
LAPRLRSGRFFDIPYSVFDILLQMRGAIDPDTGQIVCHFYGIGVAALDTSQGSVPVVVAEGCLMLTFGPENVDAVLADAEPQEVETLTVRDGRLVIGDLEIDHYWGLAALAYAREAGHRIRLYKLRMTIDEEEAPIAGMLVEGTDLGPLLFLIPRSCEYIVEEEQLPTHM